MAQPPPHDEMVLTVLVSQFPGAGPCPAGDRVGCQAFCPRLQTRGQPTGQGRASTWCAAPLALPWPFTVRQPACTWVPRPRGPVDQATTLSLSAQVFLRGRAHLATPPPGLRSGPSWCPSDSGPLGSEPRASPLPSVYSAPPSSTTALIVLGTPAPNSGLAQEQAVHQAFRRVERMNR